MQSCVVMYMPDRQAMAGSTRMQSSPMLHFLDRQDGCGWACVQQQPAVCSACAWKRPRFSVQCPQLSSLLAWKSICLPCILQCLAFQPNLGHSRVQGTQPDSATPKDEGLMAALKELVFNKVLSAEEAVYPAIQRFCSFLKVSSVYLVN